MKPDNAQESFKCSKCGTTFARDEGTSKKCPVCGNICTLNSCTSFETSNEGY